MTINAKRITKAGNITDVPLQNDPSDNDLAKALGGTGDPQTIGTVGDWEVLTLPEGQGQGDILIVGQPPHINDDPKLRKSCTLTDKDVKKIAAHNRPEWGLFKSNTNL